MRGKLAWAVILLGSSVTLHGPAIARQDKVKDERRHLVLVTSEDEYRTEETLPAFAKAHLAKDFRVTHVRGTEKDPNTLPGIEALLEADMALFSIRRRAPRQEELAVIRKYLAAGKGLVALRTTSHAFDLGKGKVPPKGHAVWPEFDREVLGGNYTGHHGNRGPKAPRTLVRVVPEERKHAILDGVPAEEFAVASWLYKTSQLNRKAVPLLIGRVEGRPMPEPVAWTYLRPDGGRVFYTSLGHPDDFRIAAFVRLLHNGTYWASGLPAR